MSNYLGDPTIKIYATDTDSIVTKSDLPTSNKLGEFKLEKVCKEMTFIAPKVYGGILISGESFVKAKGYKNQIAYNELKELLDHNRILSLQHTKLYKNIIDSNIEVKKQIYRLQVTDSKREVVYENDKFVFTRPYLIDNRKVIMNQKKNYNILKPINIGE